MIVSDLNYLVAEITLASSTLVILLLSLFISNKYRDGIVYALSQCTLLVAAILTLKIAPSAPVSILNNGYIQDTISINMKLMLYLFTAAIFVYCRSYIKQTKIMAPEFYVLSLFSLLGMQILVSAFNLLTFYLGIELMTLPIYALVAMGQNKKFATEASIKYFTLGALSSCLLLYGISLIYGITGKFNLAEINASLTSMSTMPLAMKIALLFILANIGFKLGAAPFHMWMPDTYQGTSLAQVLLIGCLPKLSVFVFAYRIVSNFSFCFEFIQSTLLTIGVLSLLWGNLAALRQTNIRRLLAYSSVSHIGFIILGLCVSFVSSLFYLVTYCIMTIAGFAVLIRLSKEGFEVLQIKDLNGLAVKRPKIALLLLIIMLSMAGIPPLIGFQAKLILIRDLIYSDKLMYALLAMLASVVGAFYYLKVIRAMYFAEPETDFKVVTTNMSYAGTFLLVANSVGILLLGIIPAGLLRLCLLSFMPPLIN